MDPQVTKRDVVVTVDDAHIGDLNQVARECESMGLERTQLQQAIGQITGSISPDKLQMLRSIKGVLAVDEGTSYQLPPPDAPVQ